MHKDKTPYDMLDHRTSGKYAHIYIYDNSMLITLHLPFIPISL